MCVSSMIQPFHHEATQLGMRNLLGQLMCHEITGSWMSKHIWVRKQHLSERSGVGQENGVHT